MYETFAFGTYRLVDNGNGKILDILIAVYEAEEQWIDDGSQEEDYQHHAVAENAAHLDA
jgi:hypothetical protein